MTSRPGIGAFFLPVIGLNTCTAQCPEFAAGDYLNQLLAKEVIQMAGQKNGNVPKMPIKGIQSYGSATGKPAESGKVIYGSDLRDGKKGK